MIPPTPPRAPRRSVLLRILATLVAAAPLAACGPAPGATPPPTAAGASEGEAFAAAEETYRAYTDALNAVEFSAPRTFEPVYVLLSGSSETSTRKAFSEFHAANVQTRGDTRYELFRGKSADLRTGRITATVCLDVSQVEVLDASGNSLVATDRPARQPVSVVFDLAHEDPRLTLSSQETTEDSACTL